MRPWGRAQIGLVSAGLGRLQGKSLCVTSMDVNAHAESMSVMTIATGVDHLDVPHEPQSLSGV